MTPESIERAKNAERSRLCRLLAMNPEAEPRGDHMENDNATD